MLRSSAAGPPVALLAVPGERARTNRGPICGENQGLSTLLIGQYTPRTVMYIGHNLITCNGSKR